MKDLALITIHGMGKTKPNYYADLEDKLKKILGDDWTRISFQNIQFAPILQKPQEKLWNDIISNPSNDIDSTKLRQFFLYGFGDAGSLEHSAHNNKIKYIKVQKEIQRAIKHAYIDFEQDTSKPIIIIAQSLGCQVISNYIWDAQHKKNIFEKPIHKPSKVLDFYKLKSLQNLITTGCNIPLFNSGLSKRQCFKKPNNTFKWDNYYDPDDVLGWPLRQLGETFNIINDHPINSGGMFTSWNPMSHGGYWSDNDVIKPLANSIINILSK